MANDSNGYQNTVISNCIKARAFVDRGKRLLSLDVASGPTARVVHGRPMPRPRL